MHRLPNKGAALGPRRDNPARDPNAEPLVDSRVAGCFRNSTWVLATILGLQSGGACLGQTLAASSPFLPGGGSSGVAVQADASSFELRGIMATAEGYKYCIFEPSKKRYEWLGVKEAGEGFVVSSADPAGNKVTLNCGDSPITLVLQVARVGHGNAGTSAGGSIAAAGITDLKGPVFSQFTPEALAKFSPQALARLREKDEAEKRRRRADAGEDNQ